jgi:hypothetical protein
MSKPFLPFRMSPKSWGLKGKDREVAELEYNNPGKDIQGEVDVIENKYAKAEADKAGQPYVNVTNMGIDPDNVVQGFFELDWNDEFVKMLQQSGIQGTSDEDVVNKWFNAVCRTVLLQEQRDLDYGMNEQPDGDVVIKQAPQQKEKASGKRKPRPKNKK